MDSDKKIDREAVGRRRLFVAGRYHSLPNVLLRSPHLSASAKLVWMALAGYGRENGENIYAWPSVMDLAEMTALSRNTVIEAIGALQTMGLIVRIKADGRSNKYQILQPEAGLFDPENDVDQSKYWTSPKTGPVQTPDISSPKNGPKPVQKLDPIRNNFNSYCSGIKTTPPAPPLTREGSACVPRGLKDEGKASLGKTDITEIAMIEKALNLAHRAVFGVDMPRKWYRRLQGMNGTSAIFASVTEEDIRAAIQTAKDKKRTFGFGWVEKVMEVKAAAEVAKKRTGIDRQKAATDAVKRQQDEEAKRTAEAKKAQERLEHFRQLDQTTRDRFMIEAQEKSRFVKRPDVIEQQAALMAWNERCPKKPQEVK